MSDKVTNKGIIAKALLKHEGVDIKFKEGSYVFVIPAKIADDIKKSYGFSFDMLSVGGELPLSELATHVDEQAALEARVSLCCEVAHYALQAAQNEFEMWYNSLYYKCRKFLNNEHKGVTEKYVEGYIITKYGDKYRARKKALTDLEMQYRLLNNVFRSAVITKGELLPTLRNIIQGSGNKGINFTTTKKAKLKI